MDVWVLGRVGYDLYALDHGRPLPEVERFSRHLGGSSANIAVGLARLGLRVGLISCVGQDALAPFLLGFLRQEGVDTRFVRAVEGYATSLCLTGVSPPDDFPQVFYRARSADSQVQVGSEELEAIRKARFFVTNGTSLAAEPAHSATRLALQVAHNAGCRTVFDMDYRASSWHTAQAAGGTAREVLRWVDVLLGNEEELALLTGEAKVAARVASLREAGVSMQVHKRGAQGVQAYYNGESWSLPPSPTEVVCAIGAGDAFAAGFLYGLSRGLQVPDCLRYGNAAAAIVVGRVSCSDAMPYLAELEKALHAGHASACGEQTASKRIE